MYKRFTALLHQKGTEKIALILGKHALIVVIYALIPRKLPYPKKFLATHLRS